MRKILTQEIIEHYIKRKITRDEIADKIGRDVRSVDLCLRNQRIKIWDRKKKTTEEVDKIVNLYLSLSHKYDLNQLLSKIGISEGDLKTILNNRKIGFSKRNRKTNKKTNKSKYFNLTEYRHHYFFNYNK